MDSALRSTCAVVSLLVVSPAFGGGLLEAQETGSVWLEPRAGWAGAAGDLGRTAILAGMGFTRFDEVEGSPVFGLGVAVTLSEAISLRAFVDRATNADARGEWMCAPFIACPSVVMEVEGEVGRWSGGLDVLIDPGFDLGPMESHLIAGVGLRRHTLTWGDPAVLNLGVAAHRFTDTDPVLRLGVGLAHRLRSAELFGSFEATGGRFGAPGMQLIEGSLPDGRDTRIDLATLVGVRWRLN